MPSYKKPKCKFFWFTTNRIIPVYLLCPPAQLRDHWSQTKDLSACTSSETRQLPYRLTAFHAWTSCLPSRCPLNLRIRLRPSPLQWVGRHGCSHAGCALGSRHAGSVGPGLPPCRVGSGLPPCRVCSGRPPCGWALGHRCSGEELRGQRRHSLRLVQCPVRAGFETLRSCAKGTQISGWGEP